MTRNLYLGADLTPGDRRRKPRTSWSQPTAQILREVTANNFPTRAEGLADEILEQKPDLVGLQEVALWRTAPPTPAGTAPTLDHRDHCSLRLTWTNCSTS